MKKVIIKVKAFESSLAEKISWKIVELVKSDGFKVSGPIPLPVKKEIFTILKSVHVNKKSREQFEIRTNKRIIIVENTNNEMMDKLKRFNLPPGVKIEIIYK